MAVAGMGKSYNIIIFNTWHFHWVEDLYTPSVAGNIYGGLLVVKKQSISTLDCRLSIDRR